jgi:cytochrome c5
LSRWDGTGDELISRGTPIVSAHNDATFLRMFLLVLGALVVFTVLILIAASTITGSVEEAQGDDPRVRAAVAERIRPVGSVNVTAPAGPAAAAPTAAATAPASEAAPAPAAETPMAAAVMPVDAPPSGGGAVDLAKGESVYGMACLACHTTGAAGAPKLGDKAAWGPRIAQGMDVLHASAINGKGAMPPKGGRVDLSDADIQAAVVYMVKAAE